MVHAGATWFMTGAVNLRTAFALTRAAGVILQVVQRVHLAKDVDETGSRTYTGARVQRFMYKGVGPVTKVDYGVVWPKGR